MEFIYFTISGAAVIFGFAVGYVSRKIVAKREVERC